VAGHGLSNILIGDGSLATHVVDSEFPNLHVLGSGPIPPNPAELLGGEQFRSLLDDAVSRYDQVIIDSPPVLLASDSVVASTLVDGVIVVVRAKENSRGGARRACTLLSAVNAHNFGAVLNAAQVTRGGYFREQLRTYYDYQADAEEEAAQLQARGALPRDASGSRSRSQSRSQSGSQSADTEAPPADDED
jgi:capsular exopolysaccharide synthesis family protein